MDPITRVGDDVVISFSFDANLDLKEKKGKLGKEGGKLEAAFAEAVGKYLKKKGLVVEVDK